MLTSDLNLCVACRGCQDVQGQRVVLPPFLVSSASNQALTSPLERASIPKVSMNLLVVVTCTLFFFGFVFTSPRSSRVFTCAYTLFPIRSNSLLCRPGWS